MCDRTKVRKHVMMRKGKGMGLSPSVTPSSPGSCSPDLVRRVCFCGSFEKAFRLEICTLRESHAVKHLYHA